MSDNQTNIDLLELASLRRANSLSNNSDSSTSSRSTIIRELLSSTKSKQIIDEIDTKISQLVDVIKAKKCDEKKKKYYTKKIITRIIDNRCSETSINTLDFGKNTLPSSTPFDSGREKTSESQRSSNKSDRKQNELLTEVEKKNDKKTEEIERRNGDIKESPQISFDSTPLTTNRDRDLSERLRRLAEEIELYVRTPSNGLSPTQLDRTREVTNNIITQLEDNLKEVKSSLTTNVKEVDSSQTTHIETDVEFKANTNVPVDIIHTPKKSPNHVEGINTCERQKILQKQISYLQNKEHGQGDETKINEVDKFKDLTPRMLCQVYRTEFSDITSSDKNSPVENEDKPDAKRSKDWRYYKTTSEKIYEEHQKTRTITKEYIIKYAKKEKQRQIEWITNEIKCLVKLKDILERNSVENLSLSSISSSHSSFKNNNCSGVKSLKEINSCLDELHQILQEKKCVKSRSTSSDSKKSEKLTSKENSVQQSPIISDINVINKPKTTSSSESLTTYQKVCPKFKKPTDFELKYFQENFLSSRTSSEDNKENNNSRTSFEFNKRTKNIQVQTSFSNSPQSNFCFYVNNQVPSQETNLVKNKSVAYILTFEEGSLQAENGVQKTKSSLEKIVVEVPPPRLKKSKFTSNNNQSELELQEALFKNRADFIKAAEWRRQCINELTYMRDKRSEDINKRILFTTKEMRDITSKKYKLSEEVQNKIKDKQKELQKVFNRQLASVFSKKLQEKTLKGQVTIATAKTVTYT